VCNCTVSYWAEHFEVLLNIHYQIRTLNDGNLIKLLAHVNCNINSKLMKILRKLVTFLLEPIILYNVC